MYDVRFLTDLYCKHPLLGEFMNILNQNVVIPEFVIEILKEKFPNTLPKHHITTTEICMLQGQQSVIDYLETLNRPDEE